MGAIASILLFPVDLLRRQMQLVGFGGRPHVYANAFQAISHIYRTGYMMDKHLDKHSSFRLLLGFREFFRGLAPELLKVTPHSAIMFCVHGQLLSMRWPFE